MDNKKIKYVVLIVILVIFGIVLYRTNSTKTVSNENSVQISELKTIVNGAPIVSLIKTTIVSPVSLMLSWKTDQTATTELYYSTKPLDGPGDKLVVKDPTPATSHTIEITHLLPTTKYYFSIVSVNPENMAKSLTMGEFVTSTD